MIVRIKPQHNACIFIACATIGLLPATGLAKSKPITPVQLLETILPGEPWDRGVLSSTKTVTFQQAASSGTDATTVSKITMSYFTSANCSGSVAGSGSYTTSDGTSFTISVGTPFGLVAASTWNVGVNKLFIADMTTIQSVAVTLKSTNSNTPQAAFTNGSAQVISYACIPVTCASGECISASGTQSFTLKTTAAIGDPADGGVIGCQNIVVTTSDQSSSQGWGGSGTTTGATSTTNGAVNTTRIVAALGITGSAYAARTCNQLSVTGGFTSGWFLPSGNATTSQLRCLYNNRTAIATGSVAAGGAGFASASYWSSTEATSTNAWRYLFNFNSSNSGLKTGNNRVRCCRAI